MKNLKKLFRKLFFKNVSKKTIDKNKNKEILGVEEEILEKYKSPFQGSYFTIVIINNSDSKKLLALGKAWYSFASGIVDTWGNHVDAILQEGVVIDNEVFAYGKNCNVNDIVGMLSTTPCRLKGLRVRVDDVVQLDESIDIIELAAASPRLIKSIVPASAKDESNNDPHTSSISLLENLIVVGPDRLLLLNVAAGRSVALTFFYENRASFAKQLETAIKFNMI